MPVSSVEHVYRYGYPSHLASGSDGPELRLATSGGLAENPHFFDGRLTHPRITAQLLRGVSQIVRTRFYTPPNMLQRIIAEADPVATSGGGLLRFEGFSACCSAYARVDLTEKAYEGDLADPGTTNVDFNAPMRAALAKIKANETVRLGVGAKDVTLYREAGEVVEKKVALPIRWLKGFVEVQAYQSRLEQRFTIERTAAIRFLRSLPRQSTSKHKFWVVPAGRGLRLSSREDEKGVEVSGTERLKVLETLVPHIQRLRIYGQADGGSASAWELDAGAQRLVLVLSPSTTRGFSGEGQALEELASKGWEKVLTQVRAKLKWQSTLRADDLATSAKIDADLAAKALVALGSRGLVGFDLTSSAYFHRELPFDLSLIADLHPRLKGARKLVESGDIKIAKGKTTSAEVPGSGCTHTVRIAADGPRCTCPWFSKYQGDRGPCKHVLAVRMLLEEGS